MAKRLKRWVDRLLIVIAVFYAAALVLPYHPDPALANQYHLCSNEANFVITADRRLVAWDVYDDHHVTPGMPFKPAIPMLWKHSPPTSGAAGPKVGTRTSSGIPATAPFPASPKTALWWEFLRFPPGFAALDSGRRRRI